MVHLNRLVNKKQLITVFLERCPTKQGVIRAIDLRRRRTTTMRLGRSNPGRHKLGGQGYAARGGYIGLVFL